jgi:hypothetical protein
VGKPTVTFEIDGEILMATVEGTVPFQEALRIWREIIAVAVEHRIRRVLADCLRAEAQLSTTDRYLMGQASAKDVQNRKIGLRFALVGVPPTVDGFGSLVARNQGIDISVFATVQEGLNWLK